jgi:anti-sigma B factor antagonist
MIVNKYFEGNKLLVKVVGRLDTTTAPRLEEELKDLSAVEELVLDFEQLEYISSAGLRLLLGTHKRMQGNMKVLHPNEMITEIFDVTGFSDILNIES